MPEVSRNKITIKGSENHWVKALVVLEALAEMSGKLKALS